MGKLISPPELNLDFGFIPKSITQFLGDMGRIGSESEKILKAEDLVSRLESEVKKIDAFKRELPLCMLLMNDAIGVLKDELMVLKKSANQPVLEEFIPLKIKKTCDEDPTVETDSGDKRNWLSSTQLWNANQNHVPKQNSVDQAIQKIAGEQRNAMIDDLYHGSSVKEFIPVKGYSRFSVGDKEETPVSGLSLVTPGVKNPVRGNHFLKKLVADNNINNNLGPYSIPDVKSDIPIGSPQPQTSRKQRRCWSTELHRRFVDALQQLGGSKVATPKQIRELMRVDGLTNDEVKSHLQKYRLHTKRFQSCNADSNSSNVVSRGLWGQPNGYYVEKHMNSQSGSPDGPLLNCGGTSTTGGDSMDDGEDEKSDNNV
ncbi:putative transcription factor MYB-HB-like family [Helianthus anomalus]